MYIICYVCGSGVESDARAALGVVVVLCAGINDLHVADKRLVIFVDALP